MVGNKPSLQPSLELLVRYTDILMVVIFTGEAESWLWSDGLMDPVSASLLAHFFPLYYQTWSQDHDVTISWVHDYQLMQPQDCCVHMYSRVTTPACWPDGATAHIIGHADPCNTGFWLVRSRSSLPLIGWWAHLSPLSQLAMCGAHDDIITLVTDNYHPLWLDYHNLPHESKQMLHRIRISEASERLAWRKHVLMLPIFNDYNPATINWWEYCCEAACHKMLSFPCMVSLYTPQSQ